MDYRVLGPLQVYEDGRLLPLGGRRQRLVLATLLVHANEVVSTDRLTERVWGDDPPVTALKSLQVYISRLRKLLGHDTIETVPPGYVLHVRNDEADANRFEEQAREGRRLLASDPSAAAAVLRDALGCWHGMPWGDLADESGLRADVERLRELRLATVEDRIEGDLATGRPFAVIGELEGLITSHPLRERLRGLLMLALYRDGRQAEALRLYQETRRLLGAELGIEPSPELQRLEEQILLQDEAISAPASAEVHADRPMLRNPYKGLRPFAEEDAGDFFGRVTLTAELVRCVTELQFVAVVGPSGSGKSSVVRAGLIPALREGRAPGSERWLIATMVPGGHPFEEMEAALQRAAPVPGPNLREHIRGDDLDLLRLVLRVLPDDTSRLVLVIDQLEELFTLVDRATRARFIRNLVEAIEDPHSRLIVVTTLRADFFDRPLENPALASLITSGQVNILPVSAADLEAAAVRPADGVGVGVEPELAAQLVADVSNEPGGLPLFEFVLTDLFERRTGEVLSLADYRAMGGLNGALGRRAEEVFGRLDRLEQEAARQVFLRLVTLGQAADDTRRRIHRGELESLEIEPASVATAVDRFGEAGMLTFDRNAVANLPTVELAHEALLAEWPRLQAWIDRSRFDLRLHRSLAAETNEWIDADRDQDYLLTGSRLAVYEGWSRETDLALTYDEHSYLAASGLRRGEAQVAEAARREHERLLERRALRRLRIVVAVLAVAVAVGAALTGYALNRSTEADRQAELADEQAQEARNARDEAIVAAQIIRMKELSAAAVANRHTDPELSLLLALHAAGIADAIQRAVPVEAIAALHWGLQAARVQYPMADGPSGVLTGPDGLQGVFQMEVEELLALARDHTSRGLTRRECEDYFANTCPALPASFSPNLAAETPEYLRADPAKPLAGTRVTILGSIAGAEASAFRAEMERLTERAGIQIEYDFVDALESRLGAKVERAIAPDLALVPQPSWVAFAAGHGSMDLGRYLDADGLISDYSPHLVSLGTVGPDGTWPASEGSLHGLPYDVSVKSLIWYPVPEFIEAGYEIPTTWDELVALADQMVADGRTPWCHGEGSDEASGWPGTDWVEDLVLHGAGPADYDRWIAHEIAFDGAPVRRAFERLATVLLEDGHVYGGQEAAAASPYIVAQLPMFEEPPGCWLYHHGSFAPTAFPHGVYPGLDAAFFPFPTIDPAYADSIVGGGNFIVAISDRPEVREVVRFMLSPDFGHELAKQSLAFISANRSFPLDEYQLCDGTDPTSRTCVPNLLTRSLANLVADALAEDAFRFDGSDLMPLEIGAGEFWTAMVEFVGEGPGNLDAILARLDSTWDVLEP